VSIVTTLPAIPNEGREKHMAISEFKNRSDSHEEAMDELAAVNREVIGDIELARSRRRGSRSGAAWFDSHHYERQGPAIGLRGAVSAGQFARLDA
jgi:hypothetical protein